MSYRSIKIQNDLFILHCVKVMKNLAVYDALAWTYSFLLTGNVIIGQLFDWKVLLLMRPVLMI